VALLLRARSSYIDSADRADVSLKDLSWFTFSCPDCWRFFHHRQASIPAPAIAALRNLLGPKVSFRTWRLLLLPKPNMMPPPGMMAPIIRRYRWIVLPLRFPKLSSAQQGAVTRGTMEEGAGSWELGSRS
jgi:hypothetical protein